MIPRSAYPIHVCVEYRNGEEIDTPCACRYPGSHPWPPHGGEDGRRLIESVESEDEGTNPDDRQRRQHHE